MVTINELGTYTLGLAGSKAISFMTKNLTGQVLGQPMSRAVNIGAGLALTGIPFVVKDMPEMLEPALMIAGIDLVITELVKWFGESTPTEAVRRSPIMATIRRVGTPASSVSQGLGVSEGLVIVD